MITILRRFRYALFASGKTRRYILYAIGEIALVVFGILIALQINNWNEEVKLKELEIATLKNFETSLRSDMVSLDQNYAFTMRSKSSIELLIEAKDDNLPWHDSLEIHFGNVAYYWINTMNLNVYETVKAKDWDIISDDSLKNALSSHYAWISKNYLDAQQIYIDALTFMEKQVFNGRFRTMTNDNFEEWKLGNTYDSSYDPFDLVNKIAPISYEQLKKDVEFWYYVDFLKNKLRWHRELQDLSALNSTKRLLEMLNIEIEKLES